MKNKLILITGFFLVSLSSNAQNSFELNFGTVNSDFGSSIRQTYDGNFIIAGSTISPVNNRSDAFYALIDSAGNVVWTKVIGDTLDDYLTSVEQTPDSGYIFCGSTASYGYGNYDAYLIRTNKSGDTLWTKTFGGGDFDYGNSVQNTVDGGFILSGQESSTDSGIARFYLVKTDLLGDTLWTKSYPFGAWTGCIGSIQTPDSGYLSLGDFENDSNGVGDYDLIWLKTDSLGDTLWTKTIADTLYHDYAQSIHLTLDGGSILSSQRDAIFTFELPSSKIIKLDANGDTTWTKTVGVSYYFSISDIVQTPDSGFLVTGDYYDTAALRNYLFILKLDAAGDSLWTKLFNGVYNASGNSINSIAGNNVIACGSTIDSTFANSDIYVIKTDSTGTIHVCQPLINTQPVDTGVFEFSNAAFYIDAPHTALIQWQIYTGGMYVNLSDDTLYSGTANDTLFINGATLLLDSSRYRVFVTDSFGCSDTSLSAILTVQSTINVSTPEKNPPVLYPNPAEKFLHLDGEIPASISLFDLPGKFIASWENVKIIDISLLPGGVYFLKIHYRNPQKDTIIKVIKH